MHFVNVLVNNIVGYFPRKIEVTKEVVWLFGRSIAANVLGICDVAAIEIRQPNLVQKFNSSTQLSI